jgi:hypothetical protein
VGNGHILPVDGSSTQPPTKLEAGSLVGVVFCILLVGVLFVVFIESAAEGERQAVEAAAKAEREAKELAEQLKNVRQEYAEKKQLWEHDRRQWQTEKQACAFEKQQLLADRRKVIARLARQGPRSDG